VATAEQATQSLASYRRLVSLENKTESTIINTDTNYYCAGFFICIYWQRWASLLGSVAALL
jgi:hypothetical protein